MLKGSEQGGSQDEQNEKNRLSEHFDEGKKPLNEE
jgi:hypothetical protein